MNCANCDGSGWVCEDHPEVPWENASGTCCGGAGQPCSCRQNRFDCNHCGAIQKFKTVGDQVIMIESIGPVSGREEGGLVPLFFGMLLGAAMTSALAYFL